MHKHALHSPTALKAAFMAMFLTNSGITRSTGDFSLATFVAIFARIIFASLPSPIVWCTS